ncbi:MULTISPECIES: hypothetical protein [Sinorhizobium]|uniref:Uncharacterized protein n=1 Tax=Rhizobium meliloti TaxID=382 RepID=A0AAW9TUS3_RHIML|nr:MULTISPECIES: hypothetical protein [Sinorhizobium]ASP84785.1 hypothetical protein CDO26_09370 [Sinorhizobium meliloti]MCM5689538.1 hypothetical protein [Sinorhizobium meliloti]MDX0182725.1 hypothetical protein [Sinorhizobium meliloti]MQW27075.1 hypothetical protein [Sinorhizobium meliloti]MQW35052.1 hypothetical protein [Sinorhizobium meliloti]
MEQELRKILLNTAAAYAAAEACALSTISRRVKNDAAFFTRISQTDKSFTARTFDEVMHWFAENWPKEAQRPLELMKWIADTGFSVKP